MANESLERRPAKSEVIPLSEEVQRVLDKPELWDYNFDYIESGNSFTRRRLLHAWKGFWDNRYYDLIASSAVAMIGIIITAATWTSMFWSALAGVGGLLGTLVFIWLGFWLFAPKEMDAIERGNLEAAKKQLLDEQRKLHRVALIAVRDHERYVDSLKADLKGTARQVYIEDLTIDDEPLTCFFITIQLDLWNTRDNAAIVQDFSLAINSSLGKLRGKQVSLYGVNYNEASQPGLIALERKALELDQHEMPKSPLPDGYIRGRPQLGKWLRFRVGGLEFGEVGFGTHLKDCVTELALVIMDGDNQHHVIYFESPWLQHGTVENTFGSDRISDELAHAILAETHDSLSRELQKCREGITPNDELIQIYLNMTADTLRKWRGIGYETEFNRCPDRASEEMSSWTPACKKAGMVLYARIEKLAEYIREIRAKR